MNPSDNRVLDGFKTFLSGVTGVVDDLSRQLARCLPARNEGSVTVSGQSVRGFKIIDLITDPPGANGSDTTTSYNWGKVSFNYMDFRNFTGI